MNERLREKLLLNGLRLKSIEQRNRLANFLGNATPFVSRILENASTYFAIDASKINSIFPNAVGMVRYDEPPILPIPDADYRDTDCWNEVLKAIRGLRFSGTAPGILRLGGHLPYWELDLANYDYVINDLADLMDERDCSNMAWVSLDSNHGIVLTGYCGYLEDSRRTNNHEHVFEIINWGRLRTPQSTNNPVHPSDG